MKKVEVVLPATPQPNSEPNSNRGYNLTFCFLTQNYDLGQEPVHGKEDHWESYI